MLTVLLSEVTNNLCQSGQSSPTHQCSEVHLLLVDFLISLFSKGSGGQSLHSAYALQAPFKKPLEKTAQYLGTFQFHRIHSYCFLFEYKTSLDGHRAVLCLKGLNELNWFIHQLFRHQQSLLSLFSWSFLTLRLCQGNFS